MLTIILNFTENTFSYSIIMSICLLSLIRVIFLIKVELFYKVIIIVFVLFYFIYIKFQYKVTFILINISHCYI